LLYGWRSVLKCLWCKRWSRTQWHTLHCNTSVS
jgi:hypothetical protein